MLTLNKGMGWFDPWAEKTSNGVGVSSSNRLFIICLFFKYFAEDIQILIEAAKQNNITFVYALSPGLDITYSDEEDVKRLLDKLDQVRVQSC